MRVAAYYRVSTTKEEQKDSLVNQRAAAFAYCKERENHRIVREYSDQASGTSSDRDGYLQLYDDISNNVVDIVICKEPSRIARNMVVFLDFLQHVQNHNVKLIDFNGEEISIDSDSRLISIFKGVMAETESLNTSNRIKSSLITKAKAGNFMGSNPPYGFEKIDKKLIPSNDYTRNIVEEIYTKYLNGQGVESIAKDLTKRRIQTPAQVALKSNASWVWHGSSIKLILVNPAYVGDLVSHRETTVSGVNKKRKKVPSSEQVIVQNAHEPIIDRETWDKVQLLLKKKRENKSIPKGEKHLFIGFLKCPDCKKGFHFRNDRKGYICGGYGKHGKEYCTSHVIKEATLTEIILSDIKSMSRDLNTTNIIKKAESIAKKHLDETNAKISRINRSLARINTENEKCLDYLLNGTINESAYNNRTESNAKKYVQLTQEKLQLENSLNNIDIVERLNFIQSELNRLLSFDTLTKEMLNLLVDKIEVNKKGEPVIYYKFAHPFNVVI